MKICTELDINVGVVSFEGDLNLQEVPYGKEKKALIEKVSWICLFTLHGSPNRVSHGNLPKIVTCNKPLLPPPLISL
jgi:hypothetical protein